MLYNNDMMQVSMSDFRENLPTYSDMVLAGEEFEVLRNRIPVLKVTAIDTPKKVIKSRKVMPEALNLLSHLKGSTVEIANKLRKDAWYGKYGN